MNSFLTRENEYNSKQLDQTRRAEIGKSEDICFNIAPRDNKNNSKQFDQTRRAEIKKSEDICFSIAPTLDTKTQFMTTNREYTCKIDLEKVRKEAEDLLNQELPSPSRWTNA